MLHYCKRCGRKLQENYGSEKQICDYCGSELYLVPDEYLNDTKIFIPDEVEQQFIDECIKSSPEFDQYLFDHMEEDVYNRQVQRRAEFEQLKAESEARARGGGRFGIACPYCHGTSVRKVSLAGRAVSAGLFGLGSGKIGKQWHCNSCGSDF